MATWDRLDNIGADSSLSAISAFSRSGIMALASASSRAIYRAFSEKADSSTRPPKAHRSRLIPDACPTSSIVSRYKCVVQPRDTSRDYLAGVMVSGPRVGSAVLITDGAQVVLGRRGKQPMFGKWV